jgi:phosphopantothenoylcysteine decarboxylase / phosphopantothenate---cysteine ligase
MKILVTAGPTREFLDPVRFLSNRSTGKMGYAIAIEAQRRGHDVHLISGPVALPEPEGVVCCQVVSAKDMRDAVLAGMAWADVLVMCAAVADWRPAEVAGEKLKKHAMRDVLQLERTEDILSLVKEIRRDHQVIIGFAAETQQVLAYAQEKLIRKGLNLIVANDVSRSDAGFEVDTNAVIFIDAAGPSVVLPLQSKAMVAVKLLEWIESHPAL